MRKSKRRRLAKEKRRKLRKIVDALAIKCFVRALKEDVVLPVEETALRKANELFPLPP